ncbi:TrmH family RNA methyltransferase [Eremococcus coleocola]|uniref:RNA methyltransferase, TrmH family n=1 Tax=Eremococcus coleocola ACS-139-V-Col8 TaxID=908337 RepID=E4KNA1_9LACT|nr:RNA methyltransferase [Eremococcus coleocola]EFR31557.1 RNA methyltransferase, TrmH family [Eremococcus coleocola ACS-139-V-Col8]
MSAKHEITSKQNQSIKEWRKLHTSKGRRKARAFLIEGDHLVQEALKAGLPLQALMATPAYLGDHEELFDQDHCDTYLLTPGLAQYLSQTQQDQGVFAVVESKQKPASLDPSWHRLLLLDAIQDPGNLGTMIRTADAAGFDAVILGQGCVDPYNDKVLRATQGSIWHLPVIHYDLKAAIPALQATKIPVLATALHKDAQIYSDLKLDDKVALIMGNEGAGVAGDLIQAADHSVYIPMLGQAESLNVAVATGILLFHFNH